MKVTNSQICNQHDPVGRFALEWFVVSPELQEVTPPGSDLELCLTVNGIEVPVGDVIKEWMRICDLSVTSRASELIEEKSENARVVFDNIANQLEQLKEEFGFAA
jgi:hypothetical protein